MPHVETDLDRMLAAHEDRYGRRNDALLGVVDPEPVQERAAGGEPDAVRRMEVLAEMEEPNYGPEPRTDWPKASVYWTPELVAERRYWVKRFVQDEEFTYQAAADRLGVSVFTVQADVSHLKINRRGKQPVSGVKQTRRAERRKQVEVLAEQLGVEEIAEQLGVGPTTIYKDFAALGIPTKGGRMLERRAKVRALFEQNLSVDEIAEQLGSHTTTIYNDVNVLGLARPGQVVVNNKAVAMVSNALTTMDNMAQLLLNLPELEILQVEGEQVIAWTKQLKRIARAGNRVRKTMKGTQP